MYRLFIAIDFPDTVKEQIADICFGIQNARWVPFDQIHLTLRFIGEVDKAAFEEIKSVLQTLHAEKFELSLKGAGYFPPRKDPRVLWIGIKKSDPLIRLFNRIERLLKLIGLEPEKRKFHPHVTIARIKDKIHISKIMPFIAQNSLFSVPNIPIDEFFLYSSKLNRDGAIHHMEATYRLY